MKASQSGGQGTAAGRTAVYSGAKVMWTAALAGGAFGTFMASFPILRNHSYFWYAVGAYIAVSVLRQLMSKFQRTATFGQSMGVAATSGLLPGVVQWLMQHWTYTSQYLPQVDAAYREALTSPHISREQAEAMWKFWHNSPMGPFIAGAQTFIAIVAWTALVGYFIELVRVMFTKDRSTAAKEGGIDGNIGTGTDGGVGRGGPGARGPGDRRGDTRRGAARGTDY